MTMARVALWKEFAATNSEFSHALLDITVSFFLFPDDGERNIELGTLEMTMAKFIVHRDLILAHAGLDR